MKKYFICILCFFAHLTAQAIDFTLQVGDPEAPNTLSYITNYTFQYQTSNFFYQTMTRQNKRLSEFLGKNPNSTSLLDLIEKAKQGDKNIREALVYLFFDKWMEKQFFKNEKGYFKNIPWNENIKQKIHSLFWNNPENSPESSFLNSLMSYYKIKTTYNSLTVQKLTEDFARSLNQSKGGGFKSFDYFWAFKILDEFYNNNFPLLMYTTSTVKKRAISKEVSKAKQIINTLANNNYIPAIYLNAFIDLKENNFSKKNPQKSLKKIVSSLQKIYNSETILDTNNKTRLIITNLLGILHHYYLKDHIKAQKFYKEAIYQNDFLNLKPALLDSYISTNNYQLAVTIAQEIFKDWIKNQNNYPIEYIINMSYFISSTLYKGLGNVTKQPFEALVWLNILKLITKQQQEEAQKQLTRTQASKLKIQKEIQNYKLKENILINQLKQLGVKITKKDLKNWAQDKTLYREKTKNAKTETEKLIYEDLFFNHLEINHLQQVVKKENEQSKQKTQDLNLFIQEYLNTINQDQNIYSQNLSKDNIKEAKNIAKAQMEVINATCEQSFH